MPREVNQLPDAPGSDFLSLDIGLPFDQLRPLLRGVLGDEGAPAEVVVEAVNRRGRPVLVRVICTPLSVQETGGGKGGAIIVMEADAVEANGEPV